MAVGVPIVSTFVDKGVRQAESAFGGLSRNVKVAGAAMAASFAAVTAALGTAVKAAAEDQQSFEKMAESIRKVTGATDSLIASTDKAIGKLALATGVADDQLRPALASLVRATGNLGLSQQGLNTALDLSVATSNDLGTVSTALGKALAGNTTALVKMLPGLKGVIDNGSTAAEVLAAVDNVVGGAAQANAETFAGQMARLKVAFGEMVETVGSWLLPALTQLADLFNQYVGPAMSWLSDTVGPNMERLFTRLGAVVQENLVPLFQDYLLPAFRYLADVVYNRLQPAIMGLYHVFVEKLGKAFEMIREKLDANRDSFGKLRDFMDKVVTFVTRYLIPVIADLYGKYLDGLIWALGKVIDTFFRVAEAAGPIMVSVGKVILDVVRSIVDGINAAVDAVNFFIGAYNKLPGFLKPFGDVTLLPNIVLPKLDLGTYKPGGFGTIGENRGDMAAGTATGLPSLGAGTTGGTSGGSRGGTAGGRTNFGPQAAPTMGQGMGIGTGWDLSAINIVDTPELRAAMGGITVNVNGGLATSADIGAAVVDAIRQFTNVSGPADIAVA